MGSLFLLTAIACGDDATTTGSTQVCMNTASWAPSVTGAGDTNHDSGVSVSRSTFSSTGTLVGLDQAYGAAQMITVSIDMGTDLGDNGSVTLTAKPTNFPSSLTGSAFPYLVSLHDGTKDMINEKAACGSEGIFTCTSGTCSANSNCEPNVGSSVYTSRNHRQQNDIPPFGDASTHVFPTCKWTGSEDCAYDSLVDGNGAVWTAKYILLASNYSSLTGFSSGIEVTVDRKTDTTASSNATENSNGAIDLNVILVGNQNINDSKTSTGASTLNALFTKVQEYYKDTTAGAGMKLGTVNAYELQCPDGSSEAFASVDLTDLDDLFKTTSEFESDNLAMNIFLVSEIPFSSANLVILGAAGSIGGPAIPGTGASGLAFATFNGLTTMTATSSTFVDMASTIAHEMGHYLGLNHPTEMDGTRHDHIPDTPQCGTETQQGSEVVTHNSCLAGTDCDMACPGYDGTSTFCATATDCQFNHVMWYTTKKYNESSQTGDGNIFSTNATQIMSWHPFVR